MNASETVYGGPGQVQAEVDHHGEIPFTGYDVIFLVVVGSLIACIGGLLRLVSRERSK